MLRIVPVIGAVIASSMLAASASAGQMPACGERTQLVKAMNHIFDEKPRASGLMSSKELFEVFVAPNGTWTILITNPQGISCIAAAGENWERAPAETASQVSIY